MSLTNHHPIIECTQLVHVYRVGASEVIALQGLDLRLEQGEMLGIVGSSGSGKSTLLKVLSGLLTPTGGRVVLEGDNLSSYSAKQLDNYRRSKLGFVWQETGRNLLPYLSAVDNVALPMKLLGSGNASSRAAELLMMVGLKDRASHRPSEMSGGEQQRVALAVALANEPTILLADEPTGELDTATTRAMFALMRQIGESSGLSQVIVSHDPELARYVDRVVRIQDGRVATEHRHSEHDDDVVMMVDSIGRLQLSPEHLEELGITDRVRAEVIDGAIQIRRANPLDKNTNNNADADAERPEAGQP